MDEFYRLVNIEIMRKWVYFQVKNDPRLTFKQSDANTYIIAFQQRIARFVIWPMGIIEETIYEGEDTLFYLHYQFYNFHFAMDFFERMIIKLTEAKQSKRKILLCCTGGMTTGFFAEKMNTYCQLNKLLYEVEATSVSRLEKVYQDYEMVLVAPQLRYKIIELKQKYKNIVVQSIEPVIFATYDCQLLMNQIEKIEKENNL